MVFCMLNAYCLTESNLWGTKKMFLYLFDLWGALDFKHVLIEKKTGGNKKIIDDILI